MQWHLFPRIASQSRDTALGRVVSIPYQETSPMWTYHTWEIIVYVRLHTIIMWSIHINLHFPLEHARNLWPIGFLVGHDLLWYQKFCHMPTLIIKTYRSASDHDMTLHVHAFFTILSDCTLYHRLSHWQHTRRNFISLYFKWTTSIICGWEHSPHPYHHDDFNRTHKICVDMHRIFN